MRVNACRKPTAWRQSQRLVAVRVAASVVVRNWLVEGASGSGTAGFDGTAGNGPKVVVRRKSGGCRGGACRRLPKAQEGRQRQIGPRHCGACGDTGDGWFVPRQRRSHSRLEMPVTAIRRSIHACLGFPRIARWSRQGESLMLGNREDCGCSLTIGRLQRQARCILVRWQAHIRVCRAVWLAGWRSRYRDDGRPTRPANRVCELRGRR